MNKGKKNIYRCEKCKRAIVTIDIDEGVTPFMIDCRATPGCNGFMRSNFYDCPPDFEATFEWFKPKITLFYGPEMREHFRKGGLDIRKRKVR